MTQPIYPEYLYHHYIITIFMVGIWIATYLFGKKANKNQVKYFTAFLIIFSLLQEIVDYILKQLQKFNFLLLVYKTDSNKV